MRIEETSKEKLAEAYDKELLILKLRFTQAWDRNVRNKSPIVVSNLTRSKFLKRYKMLLDEMGSRKLEHSTSFIDKAVFKKAMSLRKFGIDVTDFDDIVVVPNCIITGAASINLEEVQEFVKKQQTDIWTAALSNGFDPVSSMESDYIPLYDLVLCAKQETVKVEIQKPYPNEHSARLQSPGMSHIRVRRTKGGKVQGITVPASVGVIWFVASKAGKEVPIPQALRFPTESWTVTKAKKWLSDNDITFIKFEPATKVAKKMWSANYISKLPDTAFLHIGEIDKGDGMQIPIRYFPYKGSGGEVDLHHLKKAIERIPLSDIPEIVKTEVQVKAKKILDDVKEGKKFEKFISVYLMDKADKDERIVCGIVYEPDIEDAQGDKANEVEIRKAAYQFMEEVQVFRVMHKGKKVKVRVLESYIAPVDFTVVKKSIKKGTWVLTVRVLDKKIWEAVKDGELTGFSMAGYARTT